MKEDPQHSYEFEDFRLDAVRGVLFRGGSVVDITPKAVQILKLLVERKGDLVSKEEIFAEVWPDSFVEEANLSHHIFKLRKALGTDGELKLIETIPKRGYRFVGELRASSDDATDHVLRSSGRRWKVTALVMLALVSIAAVSWFWFARTEPGTAVASDPEVSSIAVLPFINESGDAEIDYLADGLTESLIGRFSGSASLRVRPYSTVARYKSVASMPEKIGRELKVGSLLTGRITKRGDAVRLFVSLIDVASGYQTWGKQYDRDVGSLAFLPTEIMKDVSAYLPAKVSVADRDRMLSDATRNNEAYVLYLKGRYQLNRKTVDGLRKAIQHFNDAAAIDPSYALAYSGIADAYNQMGLWVVVPPSETFPQAKAAAEHALSLDGGLAEARTSLGWAKFYYDWDFAGAERDFQQAIRENPDYTLARESYAVLIYESDPRRFEEALTELNIASTVDPLSLSPYFWRGALYYFEGKHDLALRELQEAQNIDPNFTLGLALKGAVYREAAQYDEYLNHWLKASPLEGVDLSESDIRLLRTTYTSNGLKAYEIAYADLLQQKAKGQYVSPIFIAMHYSLAGETELAFEWLEKAFEERSSWLVELKVDPAWKNLHSDTRYKKLLKRIGFAD